MKRIKTLFDSAVKDERRVNMAGLDAKMIQALNKEGHQTLATKIGKKSQKDRRKTQGVRKPRMLLWFGVSFSTLTVMVIATIGTMFYFGLFDQLFEGYDDRESIGVLTRLKDQTPIPAVKVVPQQYAPSGYVAQITEFTMEISGQVVGDIKDHIRIEPEVQYTVEWGSSSDVSVGKIYNDISVNAEENTVNKNQENDVPSESGEVGSRRLTINIDEKLTRGQTYTVILEKGTEFENGAKLKKDIQWVFTVDPQFAVLGTTPRDNAEEVPVNSTIEFEFNHKNISVAQIAKHFTITPNVSGKFERHGMKIVFLPEKNMLPESRYIVRLGKDYADNEGETLSKDVIIGFSTSNVDSEGKYIPVPQLRWDNNWEKVVNVTDQIVALAYGDGTKTYTVYKVSTESFIDTVAMGGGEIYEVPTGAQKIYTKTIKNDGGGEYERFTYKPEKHGIYIVQATGSGDGKIFKGFVYSSYGIIATQNSDSCNGWVFNMLRENPANGITVSGYKYGREGSVFVGDSTSDEKGYFHLDNSEFVIARKGDQMAYVSTYSVQNPMFHLWDAMPWGNDPQEHQAYIYLDKPIYKPGDDVHFKVIVRDLDGEELVVPESQEVVIEVKDGYSWYTDSSTYKKELPLFHQEYQTNEYGSVDGGFHIPASKQPATQSIKVLIDGKVVCTESFEVALYEKPEKQIDISVEQDRFHAGETVTMNISGKDYSDKPLSGETVVLKIYRRAEQGDIWSNQYGSFTDHYNAYMNHDHKIGEKEIQLDANGQYEYKCKVHAFDSATMFTHYEVELVSNDKTHRVFAEQQVLVANGNVNVHVSTDNSLKNTSWGRYQIGDTAKIILNSDTVWSGEIKPNIKIKVSLEHTWWEEVEDGTRYDQDAKETRPNYRSVKRAESVLTDKEVTTDANGVASFSVRNLKEGDYNVYYEYGDIQVENNSFIYVSDRAMDYSMSWFLTVVPKVRHAKPGDSVEVEINSKQPIEGVVMARSAGLEDWEIFETKDGDLSDSIKIDIKEEMYPSVSVCAVGILNSANIDWDADDMSKQIGEMAENYFDTGAVLAVECTTIHVDSDYGQLDMEVISNKQEYKPGEEVSLDISVKDAQGKPVESEVLLNAIDQRVLDSVGYHGMWNGDIRSQFYQARFNDNHKTISHRDVVIPPGAGATDGGGGGVVRKDFEDQAVWLPTVRTDKKGQAHLTFILPDNLTTWKLNALVIDKAHSFGETDLEIVSTLDRQVDISLPAFLRSGDTLQSVVTMSNFTDGFNGKLQVKCEGCTEENRLLSFGVSQNEKKEFNSELAVDKLTDELKVTVQAYKCQDKDDEKCSELIDGIEKTIPVFAPGVVGSDIVSGVIEDGHAELVLNVDTGKQFREDWTSVEVQISKAFTVDQFNNSVNPYSKSTIELSNTILHNTFIYQHYDEIVPDESKATLKAKVLLAYEHMMDNQAENGGFGWFGYDAVSVEASLLATQSLYAMTEAGIDVNKYTQIALENYFIGVLQSEKYSLYDKISAGLGLSYLPGSGVEVYLPDLQASLIDSGEASKSPLAVAQLMQAYNNIGSTGDSMGLVPLLQATVHESDRGAFWEDNESNYKVLSSSDYVSSAVYLALSPLEEWNLKYKTRNWLMDRDSATYGGDEMYYRIIYALAVSDAENLYSLHKSGKIDVLVNDKLIDTVVILEDEYYSRFGLNIPSESLKGGNNVIKFVRQGEGDLYVIAKVKKVRAISEDETPEFSVSRKLTYLDSGKLVNTDKVRKDKLVRVHLDVTPNADYQNVTVRDQMPAGFAPVYFNFGRLASDVSSKFWTWERGQYVNRGGVISSDFVSFNEYKMEKGKRYEYEYLVSAEFIGVFDGGITSSSVELFTDLRGDSIGADVEVK